MNTAVRFATFDDVLNAPEHMVAEILNGVLHTHPRPAPPHSRAIGALHDEVRGPHDRGRGGPGGWLILIEPELHLGSDILVPDIAGWRRERLPKLPDSAFFELAPDWVCEVLSPSTARFDRQIKMRSYAAHGVPDLWLVDPITQIVESYRLSGTNWTLLATQGGDERVGIEPFESVPIDLAELWAE